MKRKLIILLSLVIVLVVVLLLPAKNVGSTPGNDSTVASVSSELDESVNPTGLPVAAGEWYFVLLTDLTGPYSEAGVAAAWGFDYGIKTINETGGPRGVTVRSAVRDTASTPERAAAEMTTVVSVSESIHDVLLVFGPVMPQLYDASVTSFTDARIPVIGSMSDPDSVKNYAPYAVSGESDQGVSASEAVRVWLGKNNNINKIALIYDSSVENMQINSDSAKAVISEAGLEIVATITTEDDDLDAAAVAEQAYKSGADAYYIDLLGEGNMRVAEQLLQMSGDTVPRILLGTYNADVSQFLTVEAFNTDRVNLWSDYDLEADAEGRMAFKEAYDRQIGNSLYYGLSVDYCQAAMFAMQAIEELELTGDPARLTEERELLTTYLRNRKHVDSSLGEYTMIEGEKITSTHLYYIKNGKFISIR